MYPLVTDGTKNLLSHILKNLEGPLDARNISARYTCDVISNCTFGTNAQSFESEKPEILEYGKKLLAGFSDSVNSFFPKSMLPTEVEEFFKSLVDGAIKHRLGNPVERDDFLSHIISMKERKEMPHIEALAQGVIYFLEG